jgi:hypothetical protein
MRKSEVYSWRLPAETKAALEHEARRAGESLGVLLERIAQDWLATRRRANGSDAAEQERLHATAARAFGRISRGEPYRAERVRAVIRGRLTRRGAR